MEEELQENESLAADKEKYKKVIEEKREEMDQIRSEKDALEEKITSQNKLKTWTTDKRSWKEHKEARESFLKSFQDEIASKSLREQIQVLEDEEDKEEEENDNEALKAIRKQIKALD